MAHFAQVSNQNIVIQVITVNNSDILDGNGQESEIIGQVFCNKLLGGTWFQTSYHAKIRGKYAAIGDVYDKEKDIFYDPNASTQPFNNNRNI